jgi:hypothetical protein
MLGTRIFCAAAVLAAAATGVHAATVTVTATDLVTSLNPDSMSTHYTGTISLGSDGDTHLALAGINPLFGGVMNSGFSVNGSLSFVGGVLTGSNSLMVDAGNGDVATMNFGLPATLLPGFLPDSFVMSVHVTGSSIMDGNNDGHFGTITLPSTGYDFSGAGVLDGVGQDYTLTILRRTTTFNSGGFVAVLESCDANGGGTPNAAPVPLPASVYGGMSLLSGLGVVRVIRRRRA